MRAIPRRWLLGAAALGALPLAASRIKPDVANAGVTPMSVLWYGDTSRGTSVFDGLERDPGTITVANDPRGQYGQCFRYETWNNPDGTKARCESRGLRNPSGSVLRINDNFLGDTQYIGWRALWNPMPTRANSWIALYQCHVSGVSSPEVNVGPFVLRTLGDGVLYFQHISPNGSSRHIWSTTLRLNTWQTFVTGYRLSRGSDGWVEFWYNGQPVRFSNGQTRYPGPTIWGSHINHKWGVYRSGSNTGGTAVAYLNQARLASSYAEAAPGGGGGGGQVHYQAEDATIIQGAVESNHAGFTGTGFVNGNNAVGSGVEFTVNAATAGSTPITVRFANGVAGGASVNRPMSVALNGAAPAFTQSFPGTGAWTTWSTVTFNLNLNAGTNRIRLISTTANGGPNLDRLSFG